ncbi:hypothetical protein N7E70_007230 [Aminobacter sp. NyZ550]|uniref:hypothetical protein n=1 Tax=Aminobacter sp. NyZ550 TaxID=2979870 RepID=UPI0021D59A93|nr:hypothetical protein [Aminobacter sp. NyZ550]WAX96646.1 hypothetical protein N7E70_007230 [Aminobacter sp. NyZ550]
MTSEVCVLNKLAIVLASDSASTVTHTSDDGPKERYFKGANKIFQLSDHHPVGIMIFDSANLMSVPWEIIIKCFRRELGDKCFNNLAGYADEFFSFINNSPILFSDAIRTQETVRSARSFLLSIILPDDLSIDVKIARANAQKKLSEARARADKDGRLHSAMEQDVADKFVDAQKKDLADWFAKAAVLKPYLPDDIEEMAETGLWTVLKFVDEFVGSTGIVFAGYGDHEIFPSYVEYLSSGIVAGNHLTERIGGFSVDHHRPASIKAFAQTSMSDTFQLGLSQDVFGLVMSAVNDGLDNLVGEVCTAAGIDPATIKDRKKLVGEARKAVGDAVLDAAQEEHGNPFRRVLSVLPIEEMTGLAETLINLQSLKEKVTRPSQTVGGPVDVAVITKSEGLVWIKRKHYFDLALNSRYGQRQARLHN